METDAQVLRRQHHSELLKTGRAWEAPAGLFFSFQKFLGGLPWGVWRVDYAHIPGADVVDCNTMSEADLRSWLYETKVARRPRVGAYWGIYDPVVLVETKWALHRLEWLADFHPTGLFLFGLDREEGKWTPHFEDWLQYDGGPHLIAMR